jgi:molecular chaperone DnaK
MLDPPRPRSDAVVHLTFHLDANDILHVSARDKKTGATQGMTIQDSQNLDRATVERMQREARQARASNEEEVKRVRRRAELRERLTAARQRLEILSTDRRLEEHVQTAARFAEQLEKALTDGDDDLAERAARDLEAAMRDLPAVDANDAKVDLDDRVAKAVESAYVDEEPRPKREYVRCGNCGGEMPPGYAFCGKCGVPLRKDECGQCGAALLEGFRFCGRCGAEVE